MIVMMSAPGDAGGSGDAGANGVEERGWLIHGALL